MPSRPARPPVLATGLVVAGVLIAGLVTGLAVDALLSTRPIGVLLCGVVAAQVAALLVYRVFVASLREIGEHKSDRADAEQA